VTTDAERREATDQWTIQLREQQLRDLRAQRDAATQRADAAESALRLATDSAPGKTTGVWMTLAAYQDLLSKLTEIEARVRAQTVQLATANEARQQLQEALHVRDTQQAAATKRAEDAEAVLATIPMAPLLRFAEAIVMHGQPLQWDIDAVEKWLKT
jgi:DNA repair exonuclease SbcCD ATPase subunit